MDLGLFTKDWGAESLLGLLLLAIILGYLLPRWSVNRTTAILELRITEAREREIHYRNSTEKLQETVSLQSRQLGELMETSKTTVALLQSINNAASSSTSPYGRHSGG